MSSFRFASTRKLRLASYRKLILFTRLLKLGLFGLIGFVVVFFVGIVWISRDIPTPGKLANPDLLESTKILDRNDVPLFSFYKEYNRIYVNLENIPKSLKDATIVTEDKNFYQNKGFSLRGYTRAARDILVYRKLTGGSTLTQQLVKNVLLTSERSLSRKLRELILSIQVEKRFSKDQILEMYLNDVSYGGTAVGVEAASNLYFGKHAKDLDLAESAFLAGLPQAPSYYSPYLGRDKAYAGRTRYVLKRLEEEGYISKKQHEEAEKKVDEFKFLQADKNIKAAHFVMYVRDLLIKMFGENLVAQGNLSVKTTLDYEVQKKAEEIVKEELEKLKGYNVGNGSAVVLNPKTGEILSLVGGRDYFDASNSGNFNTALALRQPGSSLKPIMYAVALEKGYTASTLLMDTKTEFPSDDPKNPIYTPENYDEKYRGPIQLRFALANSINLPAVKMLAKIGIKSFMQKAYEMGIDNWDPTPANMKDVGLSLVLGGRETSLFSMTSAFAGFANNGIRQEPYSIIEVKDSKGKILYQSKKTSGRRVLSEDISFIISDILSDNQARQIVFGPNSYLVVGGKTVAAKTGTTDDKRDNWTIGYTPSFVVGVWVGNNDNSPMNPKIASGVTGAAPIWNRIFQHVLKDKTNEEFKKPDNVIEQEVDSLGGGVVVDDQNKRKEFFVKGTEPLVQSVIYKKLKISKHQTERLANQDEIDRQDYDLRDFIVFEEQDPLAKDGANKWQEGINNWLRENYKDDSRYFLPTSTSDYKYSVSTPTPTPSPSLSPSASPSAT